MKLLRSKKFILLLVLFFLLIALALSVFLINRQTNTLSNAASIATIEPENGVLSGNVSVINDQGVSGGKYVRFGAPLTPTSIPNSPTPSPTLPTACNVAYKRLVNVSSTAQLNTAVANAIPGDMIVMANGAYAGRTNINISGTSTDRITLCGNRAAIISGTTITTGDVIALRANYWNLLGFSVRNAIQGVAMQNANFNTIKNLEIYDIGQAAIHAHVFSSDNTFEGNYIHDTGKHIAEYGEGIYIGSANTQWGQYTGGNPDKSDRNKMIGNTFGSNITAENIDIKEGTSKGEIIGNTFSGVGQSTTPDFLDSWVDIKGSYYTVNNNSGTKARRYGFEVNKQVNGTDSGDFNTFSNNVMNLSGGVRGINVGYNSPKGTIVKCNNTVLNASSGLSNITCQP